MLKTISKSMCIALVLSMFLSMTVFDAKCTDIRNHVLRLHIMANSDSEYDQSVKQSVRDRLIRENKIIFDSVDSYEEAVEMAQSKRHLIESMVKDEMKKHDCFLPVTVGIEPSHFDTRVYDKVTLPAGEYMALQIVIGEGKGHNWWCVMFPSLCLPAVSQLDEMKKVLHEDSAEITENAVSYKPAFKVVEWYEKLKEYFK